MWNGKTQEREEGEAVGELYLSSACECEEFEESMRLNKL